MIHRDRAFREKSSSRVQRKDEQDDARCSREFSVNRKRRSAAQNTSYLPEDSLRGGNVFHYLGNRESAAFSGECSVWKSARATRRKMATPSTRSSNILPTGNYLGKRVVASPTKWQSDVEQLRKIRRDGWCCFVDGLNLATSINKSLTTQLRRRALRSGECEKMFPRQNVMRREVVHRRIDRMV